MFRLYNLILFRCMMACIPKHKPSHSSWASIGLNSMPPLICTALIDKENCFSTMFQKIVKKKETWDLVCRGKIQTNLVLSSTIDKNYFSLLQDNKGEVQRSIYNKSKGWSLLASKEVKGTLYALTIWQTE